MLTSFDDDRFTFVLQDAARLHRHRFDSRARELGVTRQQWRLLLVAHRTPGLTQAALADRLEVERISLCRMVDRMVESGLVERRADPRDRRVWRIYPTSAAGALMARLSEVGAEVEAEILSALSPEETAMLTSLLRRIRAGLAGRQGTVQSAAS